MKDLISFIQRLTVILKAVQGCFKDSLASLTPCHNHECEGHLRGYCHHQILCGHGNCLVASKSFLAITSHHSPKSPRDILYFSPISYIFLLKLNQV